MLLGRLRVRQKLALLVLPLLLLVIAGAIPLVAGRVQAAERSADAAAVVERAVRIGELVQEVQQERLASLGFLARQVARDRVVARSANVLELADRLDTDYADGDEQLAAVLRGIDSTAGLGQLRGRVLAGRATGLQVYEGFSEVTSGLIGALRLTDTADLRTNAGRQRLALDSIIRHDEATAAAGAALFVEPGLRVTARVIGLVSAGLAIENREEDTFTRLAEPSTVELYEQVEQGQSSTQLTNYLEGLINNPNPELTGRVNEALLPRVELLTSLSRLVETRVAAQAVAEADRSAAEDRWLAGLGVVAALLLLIGATVLALFVTRSIARPLRRLTASADEVADVAQQELVRVADSEDPAAAVPHLRPVLVGTSDELGELAQAFNRVQQVAADLVERQLVSRRNVATMFGNVGRRTQNLVGRQLAMIDSLERNEQDPALLDRLYRLDHVSTRLRRNANSLVVLSGATDQQLTGEPLSVADTIRSALGEIEGFQRVRLGDVEPLLLTPHVTPDVTLLLAELLENGTSFSPPHTEVEVGAHADDDGDVLIRIVDHGLGMTPEQLAAENARLVERERLDLAPTDVLGLFVVGRLARRHGIEVTLAPTEGTGVTAEVRIPGRHVVREEPQSVPAGSAAGAREDRRDWWQPAVPEEPGPSGEPVPGAAPGLGVAGTGSAAGAGGWSGAGPGSAAGAGVDAGGRPGVGGGAAPGTGSAAGAGAAAGGRTGAGRPDGPVSWAGAPPAAAPPSPPALPPLPSRPIRDPSTVRPPGAPADGSARSTPPWPGWTSARRFAPPREDRPPAEPRSDTPPSPTRPADRTSTEAGPVSTTAVGPEPAVADGAVSSVGGGSVPAVADGAVSSVGGGSVPAVADGLVSSVGGGPEPAIADRPAGTSADPAAGARPAEGSAGARPAPQSAEGTRPAERPAGLRPGGSAAGLRPGGDAAEGARFAGRSAADGPRAAGAAGVRPAGASAEAGDGSPAVADYGPPLGTAGMVRRVRGAQLPDTGPRRTEPLAEPAPPSAEEARQSIEDFEDGVRRALRDTDVAGAAPTTDVELPWARADVEDAGQSRALVNEFEDGVRRALARLDEVAARPAPPAPLFERLPGPRRPADPTPHPGAGQPDQDRADQRRANQSHPDQGGIPVGGVERSVVPRRLDAGLASRRSGTERPAGRPDPRPLERGRGGTDDGPTVRRLLRDTGADAGPGDSGPAEDLPATRGGSTVARLWTGSGTARREDRGGKAVGPAGLPGPRGGAGPAGPPGAAGGGTAGPAGNRDAGATVTPEDGRSAGAGTASGGGTLSGTAGLMGSGAWGPASDNLVRRVPGAQLPPGARAARPGVPPEPAPVAAAERDAAAARALVEEFEAGVQRALQIGGDRGTAGTDEEGAR